MEFWRLMEIIPDMFSGSWHFREEQNSLEDSLVFLTSADHLTEEQRNKLNEVVNLVFDSSEEKLGCTTLVEHIISTNHYYKRSNYKSIKNLIKC